MSAGAVRPDIHISVESTCRYPDAIVWLSGAGKMPTRVSMDSAESLAALVLVPGLNILRSAPLELQLRASALDFIWTWNS